MEAERTTLSATAEPIRRPGMSLVFLVAVLVAVALAFAVPPARAVERHLFDPTLSLTGDCSVSGEDSIADPNCLGTPEQHPPQKLNSPCGTAIDSHGDIYVASPGIGIGSGTGGRIDIFNSGGEYLTEIANEHQPCSLAVDSAGNLYVVEHKGETVVLYEPNSYPPMSATKYSAPTTVYAPSPEPCPCTPPAWSVAVDPSNDHLYVALISYINEYGSAAEASTPIKEGIGSGLGQYLKAADVCGENHDVYASGMTAGENPSEPANARVFVFDGADGHKKGEIDGSGTPEGGFGFVFGNAGVAVDQANCDLYVDAINAHHVVDQFDAEGNFIGQLPKPLLVEPDPFADIAVDDPLVEGEAGYDSPNEGYVFLGSGDKASNSHLFAYEPSFTGPPQVEAQVAGAITETEALLEASVNPNGLPTGYRFEYVSQADFEEDGYANATSVPVPEASAGEGGFFVAVSEPITGLKAGTAYRFRLVANNEAGEEVGEEGKDAAFATYPPEMASPEGHAYELVTPPDTNGRVPTMSELGSSISEGFPSQLVSPNGESVVFGTEGGSLPGTDASGFHDTYEALRDPEHGWQSHFTGLSGAQSQEPYPGGITPDHRYSFWEARNCKGSLATCGLAGANYLRDSTGGVEPIGVGSLGTEPQAVGRWMSPGGAHVIFETNNAPNRAASAQLESCAPPTGTGAIYDRSPGGPTHCVSLLPGEKTSPKGTYSFFEGASADGRVVLFKTGPSYGGPAATSPLYARVDNARTLEVATGETAVGGISADGGHIFYVRPKEPPQGIQGPPVSGDIFAYDTATEETSEVGSGGESVLVNVSPDGSHLYFVSPKALNEGEEGEEAGNNNLYAWDGSTARFIAILESLDVSGKSLFGSSVKTEGLGLWATYSFNPFPDPSIGPAADPSRTTPDGSVLVFQSHADLTGYEAGGHSEVYRYDAEGKSLTCISCNPTGATASSDAQLQSNPGGQFVPFPPVNALTPVGNVADDGQTVFFQSAERLVPGDTDQRIDVYEWKAQGAGGCATKGGCLYLISSGHSAGNDYLYGATPDARNVFFESSDLLVPQDTDTTPSIYDARAGGGIPYQPPPAPCQGNDACKGQPSEAPALPSAASAGLRSPEGKGKAPRRCPKGKRKVRRHGKLRCLPKRRGARHHAKGAAQ